MATNVYAPQSCDLTGRGFRWCKKDQRWETRRNLHKSEAEALSSLVESNVEIKTKDDLHIILHIEKTEIP